MPSRQIIYLTSRWWDVDGATDDEERYALALAGAVAAASDGDWAVEVVGYGETSQHRQIGPGVSLRLLAVPRLGNPAEYLSWELPEVVAAADLLHVHHPFSRTGDAALLLAKQQGTPICVTTYAAALDALGVPLGSLGLTDKVFCPSTFLASFLQTQWAGPPQADAAAILPPAVDSRFFTPGSSAEGRDRVLFVGRLFPFQGVEHLIAALPAGIRLTVCGQPSPFHLDYYARLQAAAEGKDVQFVTATEPGDLRALYRRARVCVAPAVSRDCYDRAYLGSEVPGWTLLEAMSCGTPVIAARFGGLAELVRHGQGGWLYDSVDELTVLLTRLSGDSALADELGRQARALVEREFDVRLTASVLAATYEGLFEDEPLEAAA